MIYTLLRRFVYKKIEDKKIPESKYGVHFDSKKDDETLKSIQNDLNKMAHPSDGTAADPNAPANGKTAHYQEESVKHTVYTTLKEKIIKLTKNQVEDEDEDGEDIESNAAEDGSSDKNE